MAHCMRPFLFYRVAYRQRKNIQSSTNQRVPALEGKMNTDWIEDLLFEIAFWFGVSVIVISMVLVVLTC